ncbi:MAG: hypothetical protein IJ144_00045 [Prevotella sp.]|nr:hypothetical protein [Prevotella sp.]MBQ9186198.1 hypothetical protein [Prevotella sp.]
MKKTYIVPSLVTMNIQVNQFLAASPVDVDNNRATLNSDFATAGGTAGSRHGWFDDEDE